MYLNILGAGVNFLSEHSGPIALGVMLIFFFTCLRGLKGQKEDFSEIRNWVARANWKGELATGNICYLKIKRVRKKSLFTLKKI